MLVKILHLSKFENVFKLLLGNVKGGPVKSLNLKTQLQKTVFLCFWIKAEDCPYSCSALGVTDGKKLIFPVKPN